MTTQQQIEKLLRSTEDPRIINMIPVLAQSTFYSARSGSHHHYPGGLAEHSLGVTELLLDKEHIVNRYGRTNVIIAGMFHDICMAYHPNWRRAGSGHGRRSVRILSGCFHMHLDNDVFEAIKLHKHHPHRDAEGKYINWMHAALRHADGKNAATKSVYNKQS